MVFHQLVRVEGVSANLTAKANFFFRALSCRQLRFALLFLMRQQSGLENLHCLLFVLVLGALVLTRHYNTSRKMSDSYRALCHIHMFTASTSRTISINP